jgi:hypothetical protein
MAIYEDDINQTLAVSVIPVEQLMTDSTVDNKLSQFLLAKNLLNWFHGFFKWVNRVDCEECKVDSIASKLIFI